MICNVPLWKIRCCINKYLHTTAEMRLALTNYTSLHRDQGLGQCWWGSVGEKECSTVLTKICNLPWDEGWGQNWWRSASAMEMNSTVWEEECNIVSMKICIPLWRWRPRHNTNKRLKMRAWPQKHPLTETKDEIPSWRWWMKGDNQVENIEENRVATEDITQCWKGVKWRWCQLQCIGDQKQKVADGGEVALNRASVWRSHLVVFPTLGSNWNHNQFHNIPKLSKTRLNHMKLEVFTLPPLNPIGLCSDFAQIFFG